ncbi:MAG TPA: acyl-ACP--UDP-N-acetylglucosamine O-acyltransferase [Rariglobus sp.]|jgi:UDP-N-acetylglucosamine acyltransferase|nr:acyl-ACP--UDP-N-acetylglucosamine O-acyltransferase [Rariglobus sp.]
MSISIHPSAVIEDGAVIGDGCDIQAGAIIRRHAVLGERVVVHPYAVIGGDPQHLKFDLSTPTGVLIGDGTVIREHVTINRSTHAGTNTVVGKGCFLMANAHIGHDCVVGDNVVMANSVMLAGHVEIAAFTFVGGGAGIHQFVRIGEGVMVGGLAGVGYDVPPFTMIAERNELIGLNVVGLKRRGFSREAIRGIKEAFRLIYFTPGNIREIAASHLTDPLAGTPEVRRFLEFFTTGKRGFIRPRRGGRADREPADE